ncbi:MULTISPECIES: hydrolase [Gammaproteobacteria]|uniref:hydrolase n=1 Tax=Gammaproteobacteria TaxID=1236 RepID=UPI000DD0B4A6|nr:MULTISPECIES: hydrolase [Gammaproteobacteria]RTE86641.1 hydrolase [Aliidiomarina sp. B3213]TCZ90804.1 hydrolase [Lysobacter sp. N42]
MKSPQLIDAHNALVAVIDIQEKLLPAIHNAEQLVERTEWLLNVATDLGVPVWFTEQYPQGLGHTVPALSKHISKANTVEKSHFSAWQSSEFQKMLRITERQQIVLVGMETHVCVLQTALDLKHFGFEVFVVNDAVSSRTPESKQTALARLEREGVHIVNAEMVTFEWLHDSANPKFKHISKTYLR